jgi:hypothetical protein
VPLTDRLDRLVQTISEAQKATDERFKQIEERFKETDERLGRPTIG